MPVLRGRSGSTGRRPVRVRRGNGRRVVFAAVVVLGACELRESALAPPEDVVLVEAYVQIGERSNRAFAVLHRTIGGVPVGVAPPRGTVSMMPEGEDPIRIPAASLGTCFENEVPPAFPGSCYWAEEQGLESLRPGQRVDLEVTLTDGRTISGTTRVPEDFDFVIAGGLDDVCLLRGGSSFNLVWSRSPSAWAYVSETLIFGLGDALAPQGITVEEDPLLLVGLAVSATDTSIVFPTQFGVFDRFDAQRDVLVTLQNGLPLGASAVIRVAAADRNYVNWVRGGSFNPSGQVRVPSVVGDGTGTFGSIVLRSINVETVARPGRPVQCFEGSAR